MARAIPVACPDALPSIQTLADETVCLSAPADFMAVAQFYRHFPQVDDAQVLAALQTKFAAQPLVQRVFKDVKSSTCWTTTAFCTDASRCAQTHCGAAA